jgi:hypothetical protein
MDLVLCPICRQLLRPPVAGMPGGAAHQGLRAGWDCVSWHAATTAACVYEAARLRWLDVLGQDVGDSPRGGLNEVKTPDAVGGV